MSWSAFSDGRRSGSTAPIPLQRRQCARPADGPPQGRAVAAGHRLPARRHLFYEALAEDLKAFAGRYFHLAEPDSTGRTREERLQAQLDRAIRKNAAARIAEIEADLARPEFPRALGYLWDAYLRLRRRKGGGFAGPEPISWQDIDAFVRRSGLRLAPWEISLLEALDDIYLSPEPKTEVPEAPEGQSVKAAASARDGAGVKSVLGSVGVRKVVQRKKRAGTNGH
jgi:hypothetical protein